MDKITVKFSPTGRGKVLAWKYAKKAQLPGGPAGAVGTIMQAAFRAGYLAGRRARK